MSRHTRETFFSSYFTFQKYIKCVLKIKCICFQLPKLHPAKTILLSFWPRVWAEWGCKSGRIWSSSSFSWQGTIASTRRSDLWQDCYSTSRTMSSHKQILWSLDAWVEVQTQFRVCLRMSFPKRLHCTLSGVRMYCLRMSCPKRLYCITFQCTDALP